MYNIFDDLEYFDVCKRLQILETVNDDVKCKRDLYNQKMLNNSNKILNKKIVNIEHGDVIVYKESKNNTKNPLFNNKIALIKEQNGIKYGMYTDIYILL